MGTVNIQPPGIGSLFWGGGVGLGDGEGLGGGVGAI
jgi:hypothetical protein